MYLRKYLVNIASSSLEQVGDLTTLNGAVVYLN